MSWLINRNSKIAWHSAAFAASLIVSLCCLVTLADMLIIDNPDDAVFVLTPATALVLLCSALITASALLSWWYCHLWLLMGSVTAVCIGVMLSTNGRAALFNDIGVAQAGCLFVLLLSWVLWFWPKYGRLIMIILNTGLMLFSLCLVLIGISGSSIQLSISPLTSLNSAIFYSLCAIANIAFSLSYPKRLRIELRSLGFMLSVFIALAVTLIWFNNTHRMQRQVNAEAEHLAQKLQQNVDDLLVTQQGLLIRMVKRAAILTGNVNEIYFQQEAQGYLSDFSYFDYLALSTLNSKTLLSAAKTIDEQSWYDIYLNKRLSDIHRRIVLSAAEAAFFIDYDTAIDHTFLYVFYQADSESPTQIAVAGINYKIALDKLVSHILTDDTKLKIIQAENSVLLYQSALFSEFCVKQFQFTIVLSGQVSWQVSGCNNLKAVPNGLIISSEIALYAGFIAIFLALLSQQLQQKGNQHQIRLISANIKLRQSASKQRRLQFDQQQIMNNSADVICIVDEAGCFTELSSSAEAVFGYPLYQLLGRPFIDFVHPADRNLTEVEAEHLKDGRLTSNFRNRYLRKDGSIVYLLWSARYVSESKMIYAIAHDISELEQKERFQIAQQNVLRLISLEGAIADIFNQICLMAQHQMPGVKATLMLVDNNRLTLISAPAFSLDFRAKYNDIAIQPDAVTCGAAAYQQSLEVTTDLRHSDAWQLFASAALDEAGKACWSMPMVTRHSRVLGTFALFVNDSRTPKSEELELMLLCCRLASIAIEKMQQRQALQENEQRYRSLYEFNPDPVFSLDLAGNFMSINSAGIALLGRNEEQIVGQHYAKLILPELLDLVNEHFANALQGVSQRYETVVQVPGGSQVEFLVTNLPIIVDNNIVGVFGIAKDITERNRTARALQQSLERLSLQTAGLQGLNNCATGIHSDWDNSQTLRYVMVELRQILNSCQASVLLTDDRYEDAPIWHTTVAGGHQPLTECQAYFLLNCLKQECHDCIVFSNNNIHGFEGVEEQSELQLFLVENRIVASAISDRIGNIIGCLLVTDRECSSFKQDEQILTAQFAKLIFSALEYRQLLQSVIAAERDLQRQLQFNTAVTNSMSDVLLVTDITGNVSLLNPSAERLLAQCGISIPHQLISEILPLEPNTWQLGKYYDSLLELWIEKQRFSYICRVSPLRTSDSQVGWLVTLHDITAERRADAVSLERDQFFTLSLELFCLVDLDGCFVQINPAFSRVLEYQSADLMGQAYLSVIDERDHQQIIDAVLILRQGNDIHDLEFRVISRSGKLCWLQLSAALSGNIIFCAARDITARKAAQRQLEQTLQELKRSNEELNEFAYVASHDLQEPLRKIRTFGDRLLQKVSQEDASVQDYVSRMSNAAERMQNLINDLLSYSRLNAGELAFTEVDISALIADVQNLLEDVISQTGASITTNVKTNIVGDKRQLRQLLQNLISNAVKFHKPGQQPKIAVSTEEIANEVRLTVSDQGIGFEPQYAEKIFNPFQRLHNRAEFAGTGIGLSIVKKIAERHHAKISVIAQAGVGASFQVSFPLISPDNRKSVISIALHGGNYAQNSVGR